jgi:hypothetical protein
MMKRLSIITLLLVVATTHALAQRNEGRVKVSPNGVNVNANGATTVFLTFGGLDNYRAAEAVWCGELIPAAPDVGFRCDPATVYGLLPDRYNQSQPSGKNALTDLMSIPPSVARRAYQDAQGGAKSSFFYVRRFVNLKGGPDEYVVVTCRMAGGGVSVPLALTNVKLAFSDDQGLKLVNPGERLPSFKAEIMYNGTGRLVGRWEVVTPGDELPSTRDLLTEASLPVEQRGDQRRFAQLSRFNVFLPPAGKYVLPGPDPTRVPTAIEGPYQILLRIEVSDDPDSGSNLAAVGAGPGFVASGAVAGFSLPVLRYYVAQALLRALTLTEPIEGASVATDQPLVFGWEEMGGAAVYLVEIVNAAEQQILSAVVKAGAPTYRAPAWLPEKAHGASLRWRVEAIDQSGKRIGESAWRKVVLKR